MTIDTSREAVERLLDGVTEGPWQSDAVFTDRDHEVRVAMPDDCGVPMATIAEAFHNWNDVTDVAERRISWKEAEANARFIAAARDLVPALLAERDAALAEVARLSHALAAETAKREAMEDELHSVETDLAEAEDKFHIASFYISDEQTKTCVMDRVKWMAKAGSRVRATLAKHGSKT